MGNIDPLEKYIPRVGEMVTRQEIEEGAFPCPVWTNNGGNLSGHHFITDIIGGLKPPKSLVQFLYFKNDFFWHI
jgi:hypothetical protein